MYGLVPKSEWNVIAKPKADKLCTRKCSRQLVLFKLRGEVEVRQVRVAFAVEQYVLQLDVSVNDALRVKVLQRYGDLADVELRHRLRELSELVQVVSQVAPGVEITDHVNMCLILNGQNTLQTSFCDATNIPRLEIHLECKPKVDDERMTEFFKNFQLLDDVSGRRLNDELPLGHVFQCVIFLHASVVDNTDLKVALNFPNGLFPYPSERPFADCANVGKVGELSARWTCTSGTSSAHK